MKISKRQLRRIIKEEKQKLSEYTRDPMERAYAKVVTDYEAWVKERGHITPAASSVLATYLVDQRLDKDAERVGILASEYKIDKVDVEHELATARAEYEAGGVESEEDNYERGFFRESKMKITKRQLKRIIKEEKQKLLREQSGQDIDPGNYLVSFAKAWAKLGGAVQEQVTAILIEWNEGAHEPDWSETVYEQNPAAIDMAQQRLGPFLSYLGADGETLTDALEEAQKIYREGDEEVERDALSASAVSDYSSRTDGLPKERR